MTPAAACDNTLSDEMLQTITETTGHIAEDINRRISSDATAHWKLSAELFLN